MSELGWGWSLGNSGATSSASSSSGMDVLAQLITGSKPNGGNGGMATTMATGGGGSGKPNEFNQGGSGTQTGSKLDPTHNPPQNEPDIGADIHMGGGGGGGGDVDSDPGVGIPFGRINQGYVNTGFLPNLTGQNQTAATGYGGGGGGGGGGTPSQKIIYNDRNKTWSLFDPTSKKWTDGIATQDIYGKLTGDLKDSNPEWYYGQAASSADDARQYELARQTGLYGSIMGGTMQQIRYPTFGL